MSAHLLSRFRVGTPAGAPRLPPPSAGGLVLLRSRQKFQRFPARVGRFDHAAASGAVAIRAASGAQSETLLAAERLHRDRELDPLLDDGPAGNLRLVVEVGVEIGRVELPLLPRGRGPLVQDEREPVLLLE